MNVRTRVFACLGPELPGGSGKRSNSMVDNTTNPSIFVVQHTQQAYPAYVITYCPLSLAAQFLKIELLSETCSDARFQMRCLPPSARTLIIKKTSTITSLAAYVVDELKYLHRTPPGVVISGATGSNAARVNGVYEFTDTTQNGKPLLRKRGASDSWLRYTTNNLWLVSDTAPKDANNTNGFAHSVRTGTNAAPNNPLSVTGWTVFDSGSKNWVTQPAVKCSKRVVAVEFTGAKGPSMDLVNGVYDRTKEVYNGQPVFQKRSSPDKWLRYSTKQSKWGVGTTTAIDGGTAHTLLAVASSGAFPLAVVTWQMMGGAVQAHPGGRLPLPRLFTQWKPSPSLKCTFH